MDKNLPSDGQKDPKDNKKSFRKKWNEWWRLTWDSFVVEIEDRVLMSWKRLIKFAGIVLIPIIYGVICSVAFWNPIQNIGRSELIVMDNDYSVLMVTDINGNSQDKKVFKMGTVKTFADDSEENDREMDYEILTGKDSKGDTVVVDGQALHITGLNRGDILFLDDKIPTESDSTETSEIGTIGIKSSVLANDVIRNSMAARMLSNMKRIGSSNITLSGLNNNDNAVEYNPADPGFKMSIMSAWEVMKMALNPKTDVNAADKDYTFSSPIINKDEGIALTNIKYSSNVDWNKKHWQGNKGYMQLKLPEWYTARVVNYLALMLNNNVSGTSTDGQGKNDNKENYDKALSAITAKMNPIDFWTTFERNFIFGYLFNALSGSLLPNVIAQLPMMGNTGAVTGLRDYMSVDGATYKLVTGIDDAKSINDAQRYVIGEDNDLESEQHDISKNSTLFGSVKNSSENSTAEEIGGKFINTVSNVINIASSANINNLLPGINAGGTLDTIKKIIDDAKNLEKAITDWWNSITGSTPKPVPTPEPNKFLALDKTPSALDTAEVMLNLYVYVLASNQTVNGITYDIAKTNVDKLINSVLMDKGKSKLPWAPNWDGKINYKQLLDPKNNVMDEPVYYSNINKFVQANQEVFLGANTIDEIMPNIVSWASKQKLFDITLDKVFTYEIQGKEHGIYGIGLGGFFLTIGLYVGCILQTFIFDRAKRLSKSKWSNWYVSKYMLMLAIAFFQTTAEVWVMYACGWSEIHGLKMTYVWLWMMWNDLIFITIVQALWFSIKDESIGRFLCVLVLVFSLTAGGGTFPPFTQFKFFDVISYIVPFRYTINGLMKIIYANNANAPATSLYMLEQWGYTWAYIAIFLPIGLLIGARGRMKDMNYGSHYGWAVAGAMKALGRDPSNFQILKKVTKKGKKKYFYNWKSLKDGFDPDLYFQCRKMYKFEGEFSWWKRKHHDFVQKPNYSDEDTITRNE